MMQASKTVLKYTGLGLLLIAAGCAGGTHQFEPIPSGDISATDLDPAHTLKGNYAPIDFPSPLPARVEYEIKDIQNRYPKNFQAGLDRAQKHLPYVYDVFGREGLPQDLIWLAMVESQFNTRAVSRAGASGMWQFMPAAGRRFGMRMDNYVDERFNWKRETRAAAEYMKALYKHFDGDWALAVSAYNMGEGGLSRLIASRGNKNNFWELVEEPNGMKEETQKYYPRLLATILVAKNPEKYGFSLNKSQPDDTVEAPVGGMYALGDLDAALGYAPGTLADLNPGLIQGVTPPGGSYSVLVPGKDRESFILALNTVPQKPHSGGKKNFGGNNSNTIVASKGETHKVKKGETLAGISRKHGVSQSDLLAMNGLKSSHSLKVGQILRMPGKDSEPTVSAPSVAPKDEVVVAAAPKEETIAYKVQKGDTLSSIATKHGVAVADIQQWNQLGKSTNLKVGAALKLTLPAEKVVTASSAKSKDATEDKVVVASAPKAAYTVQKGDTLSSIATKQGVSIATLQEWNGLKDANIKLGQKLKVAAPVEVKEEKFEKNAEIVTASATGTHTVQEGEFPAAIAKAHGMSVEQLMALNKLDKNAVLRVGDKLAVSGGAAPVKEEEKVVVAEAPVEKAPEKSVEKATPSAGTNAGKSTHKVAKGDTPGSIAQKYGVSTRDLLAWNSLSPKSTLQIGQALVVYPASTKAAASEEESDAAPAKKEDKTVVAQASEKATTTKEKAKEPTKDAAKPKETPKAATVTHVVEKGQTPWKIAQQYGVNVDELQRWNKWDSGHVLQVGDKVTVVKGQ